MTGQEWTNWAGNQRDTAPVLRPGSTDEVAEAVKQARADGRTVKPVGSGHSFTGAAVTGGTRLDLGGLAGLISVDPAEKLVTVGAGTPLSALNRLLAGHGLALPNLGDIDVQTVAGATATGTHGTGARFGCLSTFISALTLVDGTGAAVRCSAADNPDIFAAARVGLGALGVVTEVTLRCVDAFVLRAEERPARIADVLPALDEHVIGNDHFEMYWFPYTDRLQTKTNNRVPADDKPLSRFRGWLDDEFLSNTVFGVACRLGRRVPATVRTIAKIEARALSPRVYTAPSYEVFCTPRRVRFTEMEYALPRAALPTAFAELRRIVDRLPFPVIFPVELRVSAGDDIWLSHGYGRDSAYIAIHQYVGMPYEPYFRAFEKVARDLGGRPHWGKLHWRTAEDLRPVYPRFDDFLAVRRRLDPDRVFANGYTEQVLGTDER
jgi:FAD-linked oxidoreductase